MIVKILEKGVGLGFFCFFVFAFFQVWKGMYIMRNDEKSRDDGGGETTIIRY